MPGSGESGSGSSRSPGSDLGCVWLLVVLTLLVSHCGKIEKLEKQVDELTGRVAAIEKTGGKK